MNTTHRTVFAALALAALAAAQEPITCQATSSPATVRQEGIAERLGPITLTCQGGAAGFRVAGNISVSLNRTVTNRVVNSLVQEARIQVDLGSGFVPAGGTVVQNSANEVSFSGVAFEVPASRRFVLQISNLRADTSQPGSVFAILSFGGLTSLASNVSSLIVGQPQTGLLVSQTTVDIRGTTKALPATFDEAVTNQSPATTARVTEGFFSSFYPREEGADTGTRVMVRYSGIPVGIRLAVPDVIAGSSASQPTSGGALGQTLAAGRWAPGAGGLLLVRVLQPNGDGSGGILAAPLSQLPFGALREVPVASGAGVAVFEIMDSNAFLRESAEIPTFVEVTTPAIALLQTRVTFGPLGSSNPAGTGLIPRFADTAPPVDCAVLGDCLGGQLPLLIVDADSLDVTIPQGAGFQVRYIRLRSGGAGGFTWKAAVAYKNGADWLRLDRSEGFSSVTVRADFLPEKVPGPGVYEATITIDAGPVAGSRALPVRFTILENPRAPLVQQVGHAATGQEELTPGGLAFVRGLRLGGSAVDVRVGGAAARLTYQSAEQVNFQVPPALTGRDTADLVVTVDGNSSAVRSVRLRPVLPGIFPGGVINADGSVNAAASPAAAGSRIYLLTTGIPDSSFGATQLRVGNGEPFRPASIAAFDQTPGAQLIEFDAPAAGASADLQVCAGQVCSPAVKLFLIP